MNFELSLLPLPLESWAGLMAITKRAPRGPKFPRPVRSRDLMKAHISSCSSHLRKGPKVNSSVSAHNLAEGGFHASDSESSFSPSQAHHSRIIPCRNQTIPGHAEQNSPIQLRSLGSTDKSSNGQELVVEQNVAIENTPDASTLRDPLPDSSSQTGDFVEETPPVCNPIINSGCPLLPPVSPEGICPEKPLLGAPSIALTSRVAEVVFPSEPGPVTFPQASNSPLGGWSDLLKNNSSNNFLLRYIPPTWEDGCPVAAPSAEVFQIGEKHWNNTLVGKVVGDPPSFNAFKQFAAKVWRDFGPVAVSTAGDGIALFKFMDDSTCLKVLQRPWHFNHKPFLIRKWKPGSNLAELFTDSVDVWVKFIGVPIDLISGEGLSHVVSSVGIPLQLDSNAIFEGKLNSINALIRIDPKAPRLSQIKVKLPNGGFVFVRIFYQDQPTICNRCKKAGHIQANCRTGSNKFRGRSISKGPSRRNRSLSKSKLKPIPKTQSVWVEKAKATPEPPAPPAIVQSTDPLPNQGVNVSVRGEKNLLPSGEEDRDSVKSDQDIDPLEWMEVLPKNKRKGKKKKKAATPPPLPTNKPSYKGKGIVIDSTCEVLSKNSPGKEHGPGIGEVGERPKRGQDPSSKSISITGRNQCDYERNLEHGSSLPGDLVNSDVVSKNKMDNSSKKAVEAAQAGCLVQIRGMNPVCTS